MLMRSVAISRAIAQSTASRRGIVTGAGTLDSPAEAFVAGVGVSTPSSGVPVNARTAVGIPVVFACDKVIKQDVAKTTIYIKKRNGDAKRTVQKDHDHPAYITFHDEPNPVMTPYELKETLQGYLNLWGNGYAAIERDEVITSANRKRRQRIQLWPLDASRMTVGIDQTNRLKYSYEMPGTGKPKEWYFDPANPPIFHLRQNSLDGINGRSPVQVLRESMGVAIATDRFTGRLYGQGGHPRIALSTPSKLTDTAARRVRNDVETLTVGEHNWHRVLILDHDLKPVPLIMPNRDAQFVEMKKLGRDELCGSFRMAPHKVGDLSGSTNNNIEHQAIEHVGDCMMPNFVTWQQAIGRDILNPMAFGVNFAQFDVSELIRGDYKSLNDALHLQRQDGVISANQYLRALGSDDQIDTADGGDLFLVNSTMVPVSRDPAATIDEPPPPAGVTH